MGLFDKLFGGSDEPQQQDITPWIDLTENEQLDTIIVNSKTKPQLIFKHSTRCGISRMVINQFKKDFKLIENEADLYYLDLLTYRDISQAIEDRFNVVHESPQLLVVKNGVVVKHASHGDINDLNLDSLILL
ncbi:MAG: bacillithiol system redox-active protein YtxJ [Gelidibacter sp.]